MSNQMGFFHLNPKVDVAIAMSGNDVTIDVVFYLQHVPTNTIGVMLFIGFVDI